ncbi:MAG: YqaJ viral recombinase family protein, partial [Actinomycetota bacterium]
MGAAVTAAVSEEWHRGDWLEWRRAGIGASDVAGILGISPFASPYSVWASKVHSVDAEETEPMRWGHLLEDAIADEFAVRTGLHVSHAQEWAQHPDRSWARCTLDRKVFDDVGGTDPLGELEIKTTSARAWETFGDELPEYYLAQVMWQLFVTGLERAWVATLVGGQRLHIGDPIERDDRVIAD